MMAWKDKIVKGMEETGIINLGRVGHEVVKDYYRKATALLYPSEFAEIDCISMSKAIASDCVPITTSFAAMGEKGEGIIIESKKTKDNWCQPYQIQFGITDEGQKKEFIEKTVKYLKGDKFKTRDYAKKYTWELIIKMWNDLCIKH